MTSKRHGHAQFHLQPKKSRLDISIHTATSGIKHNQPINAPYHRPQPTSNFRKVHQPAMPPPAAHNNQELWGDDEDDVILLLASQAVDGIQQAEDNLSMNITSFEGFQPNVKSDSTSTQKPVIISDDEEDYLKEFLLENDLNEKMLSQMPVTSQPAASENMFAMDTEPVAGPSRQDPQPQVLGTYREHRNENIQKNMSSAKDVHISFMMQELEEAKRKERCLEEEIKQLTEKCQTKDGEIAMVRHDLQQNIKKQSLLRQEKRDEVDKTKSPLVAKIDDLEKHIVKLQADLDFKSLAALKGKQSLNKSIVDIRKQRELTEDNVCQLMKLHFTMPRDARRPVSVEDDIFAIHVESNTATINRPLRLNFQHDMQQKQIVLVQSYLSQLILVLNSGNAPDSPLLADITHSMWTIATKCFTDIRRHVKDMFEMLPADRKIRYAYTCEAEQTTRIRMLAASVYQEREMFDDERLHTLRRLLACLSSVCRMSEQFCEMFLNRPVVESKSCCELLTESLQIIGHSKSWLQYAGIVEASCRLLSAIGTHYTGTNLCDTALYNLQHAIVFCRPTGRSLLHISRFLHTMSMHYATSKFMQNVCKRSKPIIILNKNYQKIIFGWKTCTLQMYGVWLQTEFLGFQPVEPEHFKILAELCELTILFLQNCAKIPVHWMLRQNSLRPCSCYIHLVCASIVLLHRCFQNWTDQPQCMDLKAIARLAKLAIVSLHDNFVTHCESVVLQIGGTFVKQRLHSVFYWISQHKQLFNLDDMHERALINIGFLRRIPHMVEPLRTSDDEMSAVASAGGSNLYKDLINKHM